MADHTAIEWADATFNPWIGCTKVSPACDHCYAAVSTPARALGVEWGAGQPRRRTAAANWRHPLRWERDHAAFFAQHGRRRRVFCASLADVFDNEVPDSWRDDLLGLIRETPNLDWLLLTKRIGNVEKMLAASGGWRWSDSTGMGEPLPNVWLGITVANQAEADRDIPKLLKLPAAVRFLSCEPLLGQVQLRWEWVSRGHPIGGGPMCNLREPWKVPGAEPAIDWVVAGGESGPGARPMHPDWARLLHDQCDAAGVPFLFKQWGEWLPISQQEEAFTNRLYRSNRKAALHEDQGALDDVYGRTCTVPYGVVHADGSFHAPLEPMAFLQGTDPMTTFKVGKKAAGRLLDGVEHNAYPVVRR